VSKSAQYLPAAQKLANLCKLLTCRSFCKDFRLLQLCINLGKGNTVAIINMALEVVVLDGNMIGTGVILTAVAVEMAPLLSLNTADLMTI
jgi:hypothetical protein